MKSIRSLGLGAYLACLVGGAGHVMAQSATAHVPTDDEIFQTIQTIVGFGIRTPGSIASIKTSQYIHDQFVASGLERVDYQEANTRMWKVSKSKLTVNGQEIQSFPMQHTLFKEGSFGPFSTGPGGLKAPIVYVGKGSAIDFLFKDVRGKIVVMDMPFGAQPAGLLRPFGLGVQDTANSFTPDYKWPDPYAGGAFPGNYYRALKGGAAGVIGVLVDYVEDSAYHNEAYRSYDPGSAMSIPGLWMSPGKGNKLVADIKAAKTPLTAVMTMEGEVTQEKGRAVYGYLPGMSDEVILIESHHDSSTSGAVEDASGSSEVLALARYYGQLPRSQRPRTLMFATMDTHFTDYAVHKSFANRFLRPGNPTGQKTVAGVTIEHIGREFIKDANGRFVSTGLPVPKLLMVSTDVKGLKDIAVNAMHTHELEQTMAASMTLIILAAGGLPADSSDFLRVGLPLVILVGSPMYLYDDGDKLDKIDKDSLNKVASAFVDILDGMGKLPSSSYKTGPILADF